MPKILAIDDESNMLELIRAFLSMDQHTVETAPNGAAALAIAKEFLPDLILCDVMMPEMDGYTVLQKMQEEPELKGVPFVFLTGLGDMQHLRQGMDSGADDYLTKPFTYKDISQVVKTRLEKRENLASQVKEQVAQVYDQKLASVDHKLHQALYTNELTGLANLKQLEKDFAEAMNEFSHITLLVATPDQWEIFESNQSEALCHVVLKNMANRVQAAFKAPQRVYSSEHFFFVMLTSQAASINYQLPAQRLMACFNETFSIMGRTLDFTSSVGLASYPGNGNLFSQVLKSARRAREQAEQAGGNQLHFFEA
jgi:diguanylate cyclase